MPVAIANKTTQILTDYVTGSTEASQWLFLVLVISLIFAGHLVLNRNHKSLVPLE